MQAQKFGFDPRQFHLGFTVDKVARSGSFQKIYVFLASIVSPILDPHIS
jgi:hypothetical protein